ncbi:lanthionine synthetase LanC family protein [Kitasatospora sp. NPDC003701]
MTSPAANPPGHAGTPAPTTSPPATADTTGTGPTGPGSSTAEDVLTGPLVLDDTAELVPVDRLPPAQRDPIRAEPGDVALVHPHTRTGTLVVGASAAALLERFRRPTTLVAAVLAHSADHPAEYGAAPAALLADFYPVARRCLSRGLLRPPGASPVGTGPVLAPGERLGRYTVRSCLQWLADTEVHRVTGPDGRPAALKLARDPADPAAALLVRNETALLRLLAGRDVPALLDTGTDPAGRPYLVTAWLTGRPATRHAALLRAERRHGELLALVARIAHVYAALHRRGVVHGDVHPGNLLLTDDGPYLLDLALGTRTPAGRDGHPGPPRGGVPYFYAPESTTARRPDEPPRTATAAAEQYSLAALLHLLLSGRHYLDFAVDRAEMYRQIREEPPRPLSRAGLLGAPGIAELDAVLGRALAKEPAERFPDTTAFAAALDAARASADTGAAAPRPAAAGARAVPTPGALPAALAPGGALFAAPMAAPTASLTHGAAGIALAFHRQAVLTESPAALAAADAWLCRAEAAAETATGAATGAPAPGPTEPAPFDLDLGLGLDIDLDAPGPRDPRGPGRPHGRGPGLSPLSLFHGRPGLHVVRALVGQSMGDLDATVAAWQRIRHATREAAVPRLDLVLGDLGLVLGVASALEALTPPWLARLREPAARLVADLHTALHPAVRALGPLPVAPLDTLGAAHGWAGVLHALLRLRDATVLLGLAVPPELDDTIRTGLADLAGCAEPQPDGALVWPVRRGGRPGRAGLAGSWCNGTAGLVHLYALAWLAYREPGHLDLTDRAARHAAATTGGGPSLCCGAAGRAYALLAAHRVTGDPRHLAAARATAPRLDRAPAAAAAHYASWYKGALPAALLALELDDPAGSALPLIDPTPAVRPAVRPALRRPGGATG